MTNPKDGAHQHPARHRRARARASSPASASRSRSRPRTRKTSTPASATTRTPTSSATSSASGSVYLAELPDGTTAHEHQRPRDEGRPRARHEAHAASSTQSRSSPRRFPAPFEELIVGDDDRRRAGSRCSLRSTRSRTRATRSPRSRTRSGSRSRSRYDDGRRRARTTRRRGLVLATAVVALRDRVRSRRAAPIHDRVDRRGALRRQGHRLRRRPPNAFALAIPSLTTEERRAFAVGNSFFNDNWVTAPASTDGRDGLGPVFNAQSCSTCHFRDGRAQPPPPPTIPSAACSSGSACPAPAPTAASCPSPSYGEQLQDRSIRGVPAEGRGARSPTQEVPGTFADGTKYTLLAPTYEIVDLAYGPLATDAARLAADRARGVRGRPARGGTRAPRSPAAPIPTTPTATASPARANSVWDVAQPAGRARPLRLEGQRADRRAAERGRVQRRHRHHELGCSPSSRARESEAACLADADRRRARRSTTHKLVAGDLLHAHARGAGTPRRAATTQVQRRRAAVPVDRVRVVPPADAAHRRRCRRRGARRTRRSTRTPTCCCTTWAPVSPTVAPTTSPAAASGARAPLWGIGLGDDGEPATPGSCTTAGPAT